MSKNILINAATINDIKQIVVAKTCNQQKCSVLNTRYRFGINTLFLLPTDEQLLHFANNIKLGTYTRDQISKLLFTALPDISVKEVIKPEIVVEDLTYKCKKVNQLKAGDIIFNGQLQHPFLILTIYKSGLFKSVGLSTKPDSRNNLIINSRFLEKESYIRLTVAINELDEFKTKWMGSISQSQVKLVKLFLKQNKM